MPSLEEICVSRRENTERLRPETQLSQVSHSLPRRLQLSIPDSVQPPTPTPHLSIPFYCSLPSHSFTATTDSFYTSNRRAFQYSNIFMFATRDVRISLLVLTKIFVCVFFKEPSKRYHLLNLLKKLYCCRPCVLYKNVLY